MGIARVVINGSVQVETGDKWGPSGLCLGTAAL